ncbi:hypothetical protein EVAR_68375_1 [Eumeta japonica]|uniref:Uncharacterized protein n=1 Tax=Eumeta variegata TaxID=151549 RepID=A0A4C1ZTS4_EUMVA|nr:hypothetical protein EVAR_68375_1 [Eumeta japonica]
MLIVVRILPQAARCGDSGARLDRRTPQITRRVLGLGPRSDTSTYLKIIRICNNEMYEVVSAIAVKHIENFVFLVSETIEVVVPRCPSLMKDCLACLNVCKLYGRVLSDIHQSEIKNNLRNLRVVRRTAHEFKVNNISCGHVKEVEASPPAPVACEMPDRNSGAPSDTSAAAGGGARPAPAPIKKCPPAGPTPNPRAFAASV